ncbi:sulfurtransferase TusA family protein [Brevundimonas sp. SORGH_AS_0993]|uniref:sulfurtransferase TusA family protein n=1 Tax=Brevundimonas sp. SORGH_AS_0993 TaxID=3041794 RepID=UPI00277EA5CA|nr:sulfurtransferase TusA family protein [Brevundimonas sp. SORGH_AS_0993]MDQ1153624.1 tRNA 2-thiouridine synthesizing protein A [Brevundimonas sp. SORGH_AS_0993]
MTDPIVIDARGHRCPTPSLRLMKALRGATPPARFVLLATDPMARIDVPYLMSQTGGRVTQVEDVDGVIRLTVEIAAPAAPTD